ncbi:MAG: Hsp70 family protein, partial [Rhodospirillaceae bacterium]|nr:Hsp70 family protein [Rhodospirillaceae bacterium]
DANGIVNVSAKDKATNKEQAIRIQASGGLSDTDIDKMVKDAEANAAEDKKRRELAEARNAGDSLLHATEQQLSEYGDKVDAADRREIETAVADLKTAMGSDNVETIRTKSEALSKAAMKLGEAMYKAVQEDGAAEGETGHAEAGETGAQSGEAVYDADFEEVDEDRKRQSN